jgi:hypothetical protein
VFAGRVQLRKLPVADNLVSQALHFQKTGVFRELPGGVGINHYPPNEKVLKDEFNVGVYTPTFDMGVGVGRNKYSEGLGGYRFYIHSPYCSFIKVYTEVFYIIHEGAVPSI